VECVPVQAATEFRAHCNLTAFCVTRVFICIHPAPDACVIRQVLAPASNGTTFTQLKFVHWEGDRLLANWQKFDFRMWVAYVLKVGLKFGLKRYVIFEHTDTARSSASFDSWNNLRTGNFRYCDEKVVHSETILTLIKSFLFHFKFHFLPLMLDLQQPIRAERKWSEAQGT